MIVQHWRLETLELGWGCLESSDPLVGKWRFNGALGPMNLIDRDCQTAGP
jgi:hypothetical protein